MSLLFTITASLWLPRAALALQMAAGSVNGHHAQICVVLVLVDCVHCAVEGGLGILVDGGPRIGGGWLLLAGSSLHDH